MEPDPAFHARRAAEERGRLDAAAAAMGPAGLVAVADAAAALLQRQATPDSAAALACIPTLQLSDVPLKTAAIPRSVRQDPPAAHGYPSAAAAPPEPPLPPFTHVLHEQPTGGIGYSSLYFDLSSLPQTLLPLLPLFSWCLTQCGARGDDEVALAHRIGTVTGGLGASPTVMEVPGGHRDAALPFLCVSGKALAPKAEAMGALLADILCGARLDVRPRILAFLRETLAGHETGLVTGGQR